MVTFSMKEPQPYNGVGKPWYDTKEGITKSITSLESLIDLIQERHSAGYDRQERLNEFYILGRYCFDTCGNCSKAEERIPKVLMPKIPDVLTRDEFWTYAKKHSIQMISFSMNGGNLPLLGLKCPYCGKTWNIQNCHDTVVWDTTKVYPLIDFVGQTLGNVKAAYAKRDDAVYRMQPEILIRNDKHIDFSPKYPKPEYDWEKSIVKNEHGWMDEKDGITDDYVIQPGDEGFFNVWKYFHHACNRANLRENMKAKFKEIFEKAGFKKITLWATPNKYCSCDHCAPWFKVYTKFGIINIGWRKRVINIDWKGLDVNPSLREEILSLFTEEDVTKGDNNIHAWGWEKAEEYLTKIYNLLSK
jgi:hypothetical protein